MGDYRWHALVLVQCISMAVAQAQTTPRPLTLGVSMWGVDGGAQTGRGGGGGLDVRWTARDRDWLAMSASIGATYLGAVDVPAERGGFRADATIAFAMIGPEVSATVASSRVYAVALAGFTRIQSTSTFKPFDYVYDWDAVSDNTWMAGFGGGVRYPVSARLTVDLGVRAEFSGESVWGRNPQGSLDGSPDLPPIVYTRRLQARVWRLGVQFVR